MHGISSTLASRDNRAARFAILPRDAWAAASATAHPSDYAQGWIDYESGQSELEFAAEFLFTAWPVYKAPPLQVCTVLTTEASEGKIRSGSGTRLKDGKGKLLGIATVPKTGDLFLDTFLRLPTDAYAMLSAEFRPVA